jgi:hypothetical protein
MDFDRIITLFELHYPDACLYYEALGIVKHVDLLTVLVKMGKRASVAEWLRSLTSNHLPLTALGSNPYRDLDFFM